MKGCLITRVLKIKLLRKTPTENMKMALYGVSIPGAGFSKLSRSMALATKR